MTTYHITATLYYKAIYSVQANTLYNGVVTRITGTGKAFRDFRNENIYSKEVLGDGVTLLVFSARFNAQLERDQARDAITALTSRLDLTYPSYIEIHVCHHDEGVENDGPSGHVVLGYGTWTEFKGV